MAEQLRRRVADRPLQNLEPGSPARKILSQASGLVEMTPSMVASVVYDKAVIRSGLKALAISEMLRVAECPASESLISRWRNPTQRESPSLVQLCAHGPEFLRLFKRELEVYHGWGRLALLDVVNALGDLAEAMEQ